MNQTEKHILILRKQVEICYKLLSINQILMVVLTIPNNSIKIINNTYIPIISLSILDLISISYIISKEIKLHRYSKVYNIDVADTKEQFFYPPELNIIFIINWINFTVAFFIYLNNNNRYLYIYFLFSFALTFVNIIVYLIIARFQLRRLINSDVEVIDGKDKVFSTL